MRSMNTRAATRGNAACALPDRLLPRPRERRAHLLLGVARIALRLPPRPDLGDQRDERLEPLLVGERRAHLDRPALRPGMLDAIAVGAEVAQQLVGGRDLVVQPQAEFFRAVGILAGRAVDLEVLHG